MPRPIGVRLSPMVRRRLALLGVGALLAAPRPGFAQAYPGRAIRLVVPFPPGGGNDNVARPVAAKASALLGQPIVIDNRPGGGTLIGAELAAKSPPDGYTLFFGSIAQAISPHLYPSVPVDPVRDFAPVIFLASAPNTMVVNPSGPFTDLAGFIAAARANPGRYTYASPGAGTPAHLAGEIFKAMAGVDLLHVPYRGGAAYMLDIMAGRIDTAFEPTTSSVTYLQQGQVRALAVASRNRLANLPNVPTFAEAGLPGYETGSWYGVLAPAATPEPVVSLLNARFNEALNAAEVRDRLTAMGAEPAGGPPQVFAALIESEVARYGAIIRQNGIRAE